ncbi:N-acetylmuramoyl-L-alanine amidase [Streptomyces sp. NPDC051976]|uniref:N-acetylmuramoyl-L-alanine amidase n=1 Tax=Streptomyces sp. NPDC051976 TaxID=3154947 RepID=UPI0034384AF7
MFRNESRGGGRRRPLVIALAVAAPLCLAGGLAYRATNGSGPAADSSVRADKGASADPWTPGSGTSADGADSTGADTTSTGSPTARSTAKAPPPTRPAPTFTHPPKPLAGKVVVIDPGHNLTNAQHTTEINRLVNIGTNYKECDTTGTATNAGYPEASYTLDVSRRVRTLLTALGAKVVFTQDGNRPYGPCVDERARIGNNAHADAALSIHADGGPSTGYGFHVIAPKSLHAGIADTRKIAAPSYLLATTLRTHFHSATGEPFANYLGGGTGLMVRDDLGGLNLSLVPKVFIECGNMRNARDAKSLTDPAWRQHAAQGIADGLTAFLEGKR